MSKKSPTQFRLFAAIGIIALATLPSCAKKENPSAIENKEIPILSFKGKVHNPDGTPAIQCLVNLSGTAVTTNPLSLPALEATYCPKATQFFDPETDEHTTTFNDTIRTDTEGNFEFLKVAPAGAKVMIYAIALPDDPMRTPMKFVSDPLVFVAENDRDDLTIQLQAGIRVDGTAMFGNGTPAVGQVIMASGTLDEFPLAFQTWTQSEGKFELYLPSGDFQIEDLVGLMGIDNTDDSRSVSISVRNREENYRVELVLPTMPHGKFVKEDGSAPGSLFKIHVSISDSGNVSVRTFAPMLLPDGRFSLMEKQKSSSIIALTLDGLFGVIHPIQDDGLEEFQTVVLKPTATATLRLLDSSGQPLAGQLVFVMTGAKGEHGGAYGGLLPSMTDADGVATIKLPPGTADYQLTWDDGGKMEFTRTLQPSEVIDLGTVEVEK